MDVLRAETDAVGVETGGWSKTGAVRGHGTPIVENTIEHMCELYMRSLLVVAMSNDVEVRGDPHSPTSGFTCQMHMRLIRMCI